MKKSTCTRILLVVLSVLMAISLVSCAAPTTTAPTETAKPTEPTVLTEPTEPTNTTEPTKPVHTLLPPQTPNRVKYTVKPSQVLLRELTIKAGLGGEKVIISQLTDIHLSYYNEEDLKDPVLKETYEKYTFKKDNETLENLQNTLKLAARDADLMVITGDLYNYYSQGNMQTIKEHIFDKYDNVIATLGNHDVDRQCNDCTLEDPVTYEELRATVAAGWCNDITYESRIIKDKVMVIALDNNTYYDGGYHFLPEQVPLLTADLQKARENGYVVLLFYHVPLLTGDPSDDYTPADKIFSDKSRQKGSFGTTEGPYGGDCVGAHSTGADKEIYDLITNNGDIIYGAFCGHLHGDFYTEIHAKTATGEEIMIPQYVIQGVLYDKGHCLKITIE